MGLIISLLSGAVGGNIVGKLLSKLDQGILINSISGIVGGGIGGTILNALGLDFGSIIGQIAGGGIGGAGVLAIVGIIRDKMGK